MTETQTKYEQRRQQLFTLPILHSSATFEVSRRGSLGGSGLVIDGKGLIYVGFDCEAQRVLDARNLEFGPSPEPAVKAETRPYTAWLAKRDETEETVFADDPTIAVVIEGGYAYLNTDANGFDAFVRVLPVAEVAEVAEVAA